MPLGSVLGPTEATTVPFGGLSLMRTASDGG